jgi:hypothetical protein
MKFNKTVVTSNRTNSHGETCDIDSPIGDVTTNTNRNVKVAAGVAVVGLATAAVVYGIKKFRGRKATEIKAE